VRDRFCAWCESDGERADDAWIDCVGRKESERMYARNVRSGVCNLDLPQEVRSITREEGGKSGEFADDIEQNVGP